MEEKISSINAVVLLEYKDGLFPFSLSSNSHKPCRLQIEERELILARKSGITQKNPFSGNIKSTANPYPNYKNSLQKKTFRYNDLALLLDIMI